MLGFKNNCYRLQKVKGIGAILLFAVFCLGLSGCGPSVIGYGVLLWKEKDSGLTNGEIVSIVGESNIQNSYIVYKNKVEIPVKRWRLEFFNSKGDASRYRESYLSYADSYAYSAEDGKPPIRETPLNQGSVKIVCKPKAFQPLKIIGISKEKTNIEGMENYWYHVLAEYQGITPDGQYKLMGSQGYCFGYFLKIFTTDGDADDFLAGKTSENSGTDQIGSLLKFQWHPAYFSEMIRKGRLDLLRFKPSIGLFPDPDAKRIDIITETLSYRFEYKEVNLLRPMVFGFSGTELRIEIFSPDRINVTYPAQNQLVTAAYVHLESDLDELITAERDLRTTIYNTIFERSSLLSSSAYGTIRLSEDKQFSWTGYDRLVPGIIPRQVSGNGTIDFPFILEKNLSNSYDGVATFRFKGNVSELGINFLYKITETGIRFFTITNDCIQERSVVKTGNNPIIMFFTFNGS